MLSHISDKFAKNRDTLNWRHWRNKVTNLIKKSKSDYYQSVIEANMADSKKLWNILREIAPSNKSASPASITNVDGKVISDPKAIADSFNDFFANIATNILENTPRSSSYTNEALEQFINSKTTENTHFEIPLITEATVQKHLHSLADGKAVGLDGLSPRLLCTAAPVITAPLTKLINLSITTGIFPDEWKVAKVVPIH